MDLRIFVEPQMGATYGAQLAMARAAERHGFDAFFRSDHVLAMGGSGLPGPTDSWVTLGAIARETERIRLGTLMSCASFRPPALLALAVAQVDEMSAGRVELGLGAGWYELEHASHGLPFHPLAERIGRLEEQLQVVKGLWETPAGQAFSHQGRHYQLTDNPGLPKPVQRPGPPIIVGGRGPRRTPRLAARYADEFNLAHGDLETTASQFARVTDACEQIGRDPGSLVRSVAITVFCGTSTAEAERRQRRVSNRHALPPTTIVGAAEVIAERLRGYADLGAQRAYLQLWDLDDLEHVALLAELVAPLLA